MMLKIQASERFCILNYQLSEWVGTKWHKRYNIQRLMMTPSDLVRRENDAKRRPFC